MFSTIVAMTKKMKPTVPILPEEPESISTHEEEEQQEAEENVCTKVSLHTRTHTQITYVHLFFKKKPIFVDRIIL